jgi:predicted PhzF superfamily epimerase YddE/YHI9
VQAYRDALNLARGQLHPALPMQVVSTGLPYLIVPVQGGLDAARISRDDFEQLLAASGAKFVYVLDSAATMTTVAILRPRCHRAR